MNTITSTSSQIRGMDAEELIEAYKENHSNYYMAQVHRKSRKPYFEMLTIINKQYYQLTGKNIEL